MSFDSLDNLEEMRYLSRSIDHCIDNMNFYIDMRNYFNNLIFAGGFNNVILNAEVIHIQKYINQHKDVLDLFDQLKLNIENRMEFIKLVSKTYKECKFKPILDIKLDWFYNRLNKRMIEGHINTLEDKKKKLEIKYDHMKTKPSTVEIKLLEIKIYISVCEKYLLLLDEKCEIVTNIRAMCIVLCNFKPLSIPA